MRVKALLVSSAVIASLLVVMPVAAQTAVYARQLQGPFDPGGRYSLDDVPMHAVYETLITVNEKGDIQPGLALSWTISPDFRTYTFKLRPDVKFHDGTPLTGEAVKWSFVRMLKIDRTPYGLFRKVGDENGIEVPDPLTVRIRLKERLPLFLVDLVAPAYFVVSDAAKKHATPDDPYAAKWLTMNASGTGPFRLVEWIQDQRIVLERFPGYWGGAATGKTLASIDRVVISKVPDPSAARIMLEKGEADIVEKLTDEQFAALTKTPGIVVKDFDRPRLTYLTMDVRQKPFDSVKVRQAIAHAVNYDEIIQKILQGRAKRLRGLITEGLLGFDPSVPLYSYDPAKARQLLAEAGYPGGFSTGLSFVAARGPEFTQVAEYIQAYLGKVGIQVRLESITIQAQVSKMSAGNYGLALRNWDAVIPDPDDTVGWLYDASRDSGGYSASFWMDPSVIEKMKRTRETPDPAVRGALLREVSMKVVEEAIYVPLYQPRHLLAWRARLESVRWDPFMGLHLWTLKKK